MYEKESENNEVYLTDSMKMWADLLALLFVIVSLAWFGV